MVWNRVGFTLLAQVVIEAYHALVTSPNNLLLASIATGGVLLASVMLDDEGLGVRDLDEVVWVLLRCDRETPCACVIIRAVQAFESVTINLGIAHVTDGIVQDWLGFGLCSQGLGRNRGLVCFSFAFVTENGMNDDTTGLFDLKEFMGHGMTTPPILDARGAHIVVRTIQTLMPDTANGRFADITNNTRVNR